MTCCNQNLRKMGILHKFKYLRPLSLKRSKDEGVLDFKELFVGLKCLLTIITKTQRKQEKNMWFWYFYDLCGLPLQNGQKGCKHIIHGSRVLLAY